MNKVIILLSFAVFMLSACGKSDESQVEQKKGENTKSIEPSTENDGKGIGPVKNIILGKLDPAMADEGKTIFTTNCSACHKIETKFVGPALADVTNRRKPEWIMNMILNPEVMVKEDPIAKELLATFLAPMANQHLNEEQARKILEFFRQNDSK